MPFPPHIDQVFDDYRVAADTKAALYDLYVSMGDAVLDVFSDIAERVASPSLLRPEDTESIRNEVVERFLKRHHPSWLAGVPTPSLWHPRVLEGRAAGPAIPLRPLSDQARAAVGERPPLPHRLARLRRKPPYGR